MKKKVFITGSNGLLGQKLVHLLRVDKQVELIAASKGENRISVKEGYRYINLDITDALQMEKSLFETLPDVVINTAAMTNVDACESQKEECWQLNVIAVQQMVNVLTTLKEKQSGYDPHFIHLSTDFVFNGEAGPYTESDRPDPLSYYALSKFESEKIVQQSSLKWAIARTIIVYGIAEAMSRTNIVLWAKGALEKGEPLSIVDDQFRMPTLAEDLAAGCILIFKKGATGIFHLSGKDFMNIVELVQRVAVFFKLNADLVKPIKSNTLNQAAKRPPRTGFVLNKAIAELGYDPHSFEEGLAILQSQL
ncbi:MAG TPA: SDR family oxidoreductase [Flavobacteriales bacterium]|nr:SDR family oxidoreductase [Flavobacteriales bacterium]HRE97323.1 SDR family oxidoreductase [Flavobacteriales bacterium]HRJ40127.1 SDR family oxidoreductase [Flavobacteriales bacterium]